MLKKAGNHTIQLETTSILKKHLTYGGKTTPSIILRRPSHAGQETPEPLPHTYTTQRHRSPCENHRDQSWAGLRRVLCRGTRKFFNPS
jgi:hypothetical protein